MMGNGAEITASPGSSSSEIVSVIQMVMPLIFSLIDLCIEIGKGSTIVLMVCI